MTERTAVPERVLTRVPLWDGPLPSVDSPIPRWPGAVQDFGGVRMHARRTDGTGTGGATAVYVHGLGGSSANWTDLAGLLAGHAAGVALDLPGTGASEPPAGYVFSLDSIADAVATALRSFPEPVHLLGNSMGGAVSMLVAARHPELVRTLTLISPAVPDLRPLTSRMSDRRLPLAFVPVLGRRVRRALAAASPQQRAEQVIRLCFADPDRVPQARLAEAADEVRERMAIAWDGPSLAASTGALLRAWLVPRSRSLWSTAPRIQAPTLVVWGTEDRLVTVRKAPRTTRLIPHARLLVLPRTGHVAQMERPVTVARAVLGMWHTDPEDW